MAEKAAKKGLGAGLGAIFGAEALDGIDDITTLPISKVEPRENQPRTHFDELALEELAQSIREYGLIQPITVRKLDSGYYQIIAGERRWRASRIAGLTEVPVRVLEADDRRTSEIALIENLQREDLNPIEEAFGYKALMDDYGLTQEQVAQSVGRSRPTVANMLRLLALPKEVLDFLEAGVLTTGHARALLAIQEEDVLISTAQTVVERELTVRQTETLAAKIAKDLDAVVEEKPLTEIVVDYRAELENDLAKALSRKVKIQQGRKKGWLQLEFYSPDDMEALVEALYTIKPGSRRARQKENC